MDVPSHSDAPHAWLRTLAAWLLLFVALALYAAAALAPRLLQYVRLQHESEVNQHRLVALELDVERLDRIATALEKDPEFARALARANFEQPDGEERIPLPESLKVDFSAGRANLDLPDPAWPWYTPLLQRIVDDVRLANALLAAAALLAMASFVWPALAESPSGGLWRVLAGRYRTRKAVAEPPGDD